MKNHMEYFSDTELERLIREIEEQDLIPAPPDLRETILEAWEEENTALEEQKAGNKRKKIAEYKRFRTQVFATVAAAVLAVFLLPGFEDLQRQKNHWAKPVINQNDEKGHWWIPEEKERESESRMFEGLLGGVNIFADNNRWNLFK